MTATCTACQVTLPGVRSLIERADALADACMEYAQERRLTLIGLGVPASTITAWDDVDTALRAYRTVPPPTYTDDNTPPRPLCAACFWKAASA